jgi:hypothetical protein
VRTVAVGVALLVAVASGCSGTEAAPAEVGPLASRTPAIEQSAGTSASRRASKPSSRPVPTAALIASPQGASAFARYYIAVLNDAFAAKDASLVRQLSDPACQGCRNLIGAIEGPSNNGERVEGGDFSIDYAEAREVAPGDALVDIRYSVEPIRILDAKGRLLETRPRTTAIDAQLRLLMVGDAWSVRGFRNTPT